MDYCLVEHWHPNIQFPSGAQLVALSEHVVYHFDRHQISYVTMEEFYNSGDLKGDTEKYLREQLVWLNQFDHYIQGIYPQAKEQKLRLAMVFSEPIKARVDNVILTTRILCQFMEKGQPSKIWYYDRQHEPDHVSYNFKFYSETVYSRVLDAVCQKLNVAFERVYVHLPEKGSVSLNKRINPKESIKVFLKKIKFFHDLKDKRGLSQLYKNRSNRPSHIHDGKRPKILFLHHAPFVLDFCSDLQKEGFEVLFRHKRHIYRYDDQNDKTYRKIDVFKECTNNDIKSISDEEFNAFYKSPIMQWINDQANDIDVRDVMKAIFERFLRNYCPEMIVKVKQFIDFYNRYEIDYVANHSPTLAPDVGFKNPWCIDYFAAMVAAELSEKTFSVGLCHGIDAFESKMCFSTQTSLNDIFIFGTKAEADHEKKLKGIFEATTPQAYHMKYFLERRKKQIQMTKAMMPEYRTYQGQPVVVFVPIMFVPMPQRKFEKSQSFPMEYLGWHQALLEYMHERKDYYFIWKGLFLKSQDRAFDLIQCMIEDRQYTNIEFHSNKLLPWLNVAERVICDIPSSAFFEAVSAGKSAIALYRTNECILRANAQEQLGESIRRYGSPEEGVAQVKYFLDTKKEQFVAPMNDPELSLPKILLNHLKQDDLQANRKTQWRTATSTTCTISR